MLEDFGEDDAGGASDEVKVEPLEQSEDSSTFEEEDLPDNAVAGDGASVEDLDEVKDETLAEKGGTPWKLILSVILTVLSVATIGALFYFKSDRQVEERNVSPRIKVEETIGTRGFLSRVQDPVYYVMAPFLIPIDNGRAFFRLEVIFPRLTAGFENKIEASPYLYREAILRLIESKSMEELKSPGAKMMLKNEIESSFDSIMGKGVSGGVVFGLFEIK